MLCRIDSTGGKGPFSPLFPSDWTVCVVYGAAIATLQLCREGQGKLRVPSCQLALELPKGGKKKHCSVVSNSLQLHRMQPSRLLCPQDSLPTGVGSHSHLPDPGTEPMSPALQADSLLSKPQGTPPPKTLFYLRHLNALQLQLLASVRINLIMQQ